MYSQIIKLALEIYYATLQELRKGSSLASISRHVFSLTFKQFREWRKRKGVKIGVRSCV